MSEPRLDTDRAHPARRYDYWLGGKDNFAADRASGDAVAAAFPGIRIAVIENRKFLRRVVAHLAAEGMDQFLDIGTGLPTAANVHEVAQGANPRARVVYVDNDPLVLAHARALLSGDPRGATAYLDADLRHPERILGDPVLRETLDLARPTVLMLVAVLHFVAEDELAYGAVRTLVDALAPGSYVVLSHATADLMPAEIDRALEAVPGRGSFTPRTRDQVARFFDGLDLLPPGLGLISEWRPEPGETPPAAADVAAYGAVARVPGPTG